MLNNADVRGSIAKFVDPVAKKLLDWGIAPDAITYLGALGVAVPALYFFPRGQFIPGVLIATVFVFSDLLDGTMARMSGRASKWGNFLDSTTDRVTDGAVFGGILIFYAARGDALGTAAAWVCLVGAFVISYAKARAESLGATANVGIAERAERLIIVFVAAFFSSFGIPWLLTGAMTILAILVLITVGQRFATIRSQLHLVRPPGTESTAAGSPETPETETDGESEQS